MKEIATRLGTEDWPLIDVTLKQFSLPWSQEWQGTKDAYLLRMIEEAPDQELIDLAQHVGFQFEEVTTLRVESPFWRKGMLRVFLGHLATHRVFAAELQEALLDFGISCFVAHNDIEPTEEWQGQIETALATCEALVALLHQNFHASNWTDQEIGFAMGRGVPAFAVSFGQDGSQKTAIALARELFDAYRKNKQTQRRMSEVLVGLFEQSGSFADAKARIGYLEDLTLWEPSFSTRVGSAAKSNSQIYGSWGVPERVRTLVKKWAKSGV